MKKIKLNNLGYLEGPSVHDATIELEIEDDVALQISNWKATELWQYDWNTKTFNLIQSPYLEDLRFARAMECFPIINRGMGWYLLLSEEQKAELTTWYQAWLDVTETKIIPTKPDWLD